MTFENKLGLDNDHFSILSLYRHNSRLRDVRNAHFRLNVETFKFYEHFTLLYQKVNSDRFITFFTFT